MKNLVFVLLISFFGIEIGFSQSSSPSLQVGLGGVTYTRGDLNTEVIAELITKKQNELKVRLIQTMLLDDLDKSGGVITAYTSDLLNTVLSGTSPNIQTQNILESTANVAVVLAFVNHYVGVIDGEERANLNKLAISLGYVLPRNYDEIEPPSSLIELIQNPIYNEKSNAFDNDSDEVKNTDIENEIFIKLTAYLIDIASEALQNNEVLKERGLFRFADSDWYKSENLYLNLKTESPSFSQIGFFRSYITIANIAEELALLEQEIFEAEEKIGNQIDNPESEQELQQGIIANRQKLINERNRLKREIEENEQTLAQGTSIYARDVYEDMRKFVDSYVRAFGVFDFIFRNGLDINSINADFANNLNMLADELIVNDAKRQLDLDEIDLEVLQDVNVLLKDLLNEIPAELRLKYEPLFAEFEKLIFKYGLDSADDFKDYELIYLLGKQIIPAAREMAVLAGDNSSIELVLRVIELRLISNAVTILNDELDLLDQERQAFASFYELFGSIQNLDEIESYEKFLQSFYTSLDVFGDGKLKSTLQKIVGLTTDHIEFVKTDSADYMDIDVEGILVSLSDLKYDKWRPINLYFTVGGNTMSFLDKQVVGDNQISTFQYFGEKIGVKFKLLDWAYTRSFNNGETFSYWGNTYIRKTTPKQPFISDFHFLVYSSGLLYNLVGTSSDNEFDSALLAAGFGFSFFNGLDFNVAMGKPIGITDGEMFLNFGFDIRFVEYLQAIGKN